MTCLVREAEGFWVALLEHHDLKKYRQLVADIDMPDSDKDELIGIVADIMAHFVDAAFGQTSEQITLEQRKDSASPRHLACDKLSETQEKQTIEGQCKRVGLVKDSGKEHKP